jgi:hypothetical protein
MMNKIFRLLLTSGVIVVFATATQASQAAEQGTVRDSHQEEKSIVGSWIGTIDNGERVVMSFTSDGIEGSSVQGAVKLTSPVLTPGHGVWAPLGGRQFAITDVVILYDIHTGDYRGSGKLRATLTLARGGDRMNGRARIDIFAPDGTLAVSFLHTVSFTRIKIEPLD